MEYVFTNGTLGDSGLVVKPRKSRQVSCLSRNNKDKAVDVASDMGNSISTLLFLQ